MAFGTKRQGAVLCPGCGKLVGVNDRECLSCGRRNPGMFGLAGVLRFDTDSVLKILLDANIGLEVMDTRAACRTFNILAAEGREVVAALMPLER